MFIKIKKHIERKHLKWKKDTDVITAGNILELQMTTLTTHYAHIAVLLILGIFNLFLRQ